MKKTSPKIRHWSLRNSDDEINKTIEDSDSLNGSKNDDINQNLEEPPDLQKLIDSKEGD